MLKIGSRGSLLALWQANWVKEQLAAKGHPATIEVIETTGDKMTDVPVGRIGSKGVFTKEIEDALLAGKVDLAVHSLKDLPTDLPAGLTIASIPAREDPHDALVGPWPFREIPRGARIGTSSLRRAAQIRAQRDDLHIEPIRGNLDTRIRKYDEGQYDALIVAAAGLKRLGMEDRIQEILSTEIILPAPGQGALAIETREKKDDAGLVAARLLNDNAAAICVAAERALLASLGGGCQVPIGAWARKDMSLVHLEAVVVSPDGGMLIRKKTSGQARQPEKIGARLAQLLLDAGAKQILDRVYS